jgi:SAM-dependent methyltransferase
LNGPALKMLDSTPYDDLPYRSYPIEWSAPERLALASMLHGGPRMPLSNYRVLELGCGDGANLLALAYYRREAKFVGLDGASSQTAVAERRRSELRLSNVEFIAADFIDAADRLSGQFDYILAHGVFSWVNPLCREALWSLFAQRLKPGGLIYLNYNTFPGWKVRGMVRDYLLSVTAGSFGLSAKARAAQEAAHRVLESLIPGAHAYRQLIENEFRIVCEGNLTYVAHEYLAADNHAFWRSEFLASARSHGLEHVADADFAYASGRTPDGLPKHLQRARLVGDSVEDAMDLLCYRQLHSPILTQASLRRQPIRAEEIEHLTMASCLVRRTDSVGPCPVFVHPSGYEVAAKEAVIESALAALKPLWPRGLRIGSLFPDVSHVAEDLTLLHRNGLIELRCLELDEEAVDAAPLHRVEVAAGAYRTSLYHTVELVAQDVVH